MLDIVLFVLTLAAIFAAAIVRFNCIMKLMREYTVDEYLTSPRARRLWITSTAMIPITALGIVLLASFSHIWWVTASAAAFASLVLLKAGWVVWMRFSGRYREFYRQQQWR